MSWRSKRDAKGDRHWIRKARKRRRWAQQQPEQHRCEFCGSKGDVTVQVTRRKSLKLCNACSHEALYGK